MWKLPLFAGQQTVRQTRAGFYSAGQYVKALEHVWNRLYGENSFERRFNVRYGEEVSEECEASHVVSQVKQIQSKSDIQGKVIF